MRHHLFSQTDFSDRGRPDRLRARVAVTRLGRALLVGLVFASTSFTQQAHASVQFSGNVFPADKVDTPDIDEGLPASGTPPINSDEPLTAVGQVGFEVKQDVTVGQTSFGTVLISGQSTLRYEDLIIGDQGQIGGPASPTRRGTGVVSITGFGSLYNNDYNVLPAEVSPPNVTGFGSIRAADDTDGFDVYVGRAGTGTLQINAGGRAEIEDAAIVGDLANSAGTLTVDGFDSFFGSGGFQGNAGATPHAMIIGHLGTGTLSISNGGQVYALAPKSADTYIVAAVIGGDPASIQQPRPFPGGQGTATVDGIGSKWVIGGSFQVGGFDSTKIQNTPATQDVPGAFAQYPSNSGGGTLYVNNGALVNVVSPTVVTPQGSLDLDVLVGLKGQIHLAGGSLHIDNAAVGQGSGQQAIPAIDTYRLLNDGMVGGSGAITVGQFRNRSLGQVHVVAGEKLVVTATGEFIANSLTSEEPLSNFGLMDVLGTETTRGELDFNASPTPVTGSTTVPRPFVNFQQAVAPTNGGRQIGQITVQSGTLRFQSGLENHGFLSFTGGTNVVSGKVFNCLGNDPACVAAPTNGAGTVSVSGNGTSVTFEDNTFLAGNFQVLGVNNTVSFKDPPTISGLFNVQSPTANISVIGDLTLANGADVRVAIGATFNVTDNLIVQPGFIRLSPIISGLGSFAAGDLFTILTYGGSILPSDTVFTTLPLNLGNGLTLIPLQPSDTPHLIVVKVVSSNALPINDADLDGNGIVNANDLAIWKTRFGLSGLGDVNGNGIVDAADYTLIRDHFGHPSGAGAGAGFGAAVPEPGSVALLLTGGLLALSVVRRERAR